MTENAAASHLRTDLSIDQTLALKTAASRLQSEFADMFGRRNDRTIPAFVL